MLETAPELKGRTVEEVRILGNTRVPTSVIMTVVRSREGEAFDPRTVEEDYQRIYGMKRFANVEAKVEPTETGVAVIFIVHETRQIRSISYRGNKDIQTSDLQEAVDLSIGEAIDPFRMSIAKRSIETLYHDKNFPFAHVDVPAEALEQRGDVIFNITEGPHVRIRKVRFEGNYSMPADRLMDQISTRSWIFIFRNGTFDSDQIDDDVAALRQYYLQKGYFDVRVGRKLAFSKDLTEVMVTFLIEEGQRYTIDRVLFKGGQQVSEARLRENMKLTEGRPYDQEVLRRDMRQMVRAYSPLGYIYDPQRHNDEYLWITDRTIFRREAGKVDLIYEIHEGRPFYLGRTHIKGNSKTQDKLAERELRVSPGQLYNSAELQDAIDRLRGTPYFSSAIITPIGEDPETRDILVEVTEKPTASFMIGAGINSNGGVGGHITYQQRNFDIANWPSTPSDIFTDRAFVGAGQTLRISLEPGTQQTNASILFGEPYLFDLPYSFSIEGYLHDRIREHWDERRLGGRTSFGKRFNYTWSALLTLRGEDVEVRDIDDEGAFAPDGQSIRAPEINALAGHSTLTSAGIEIRRDTTNRGFFPDRGSTTTVGWEHAGALGGQFNYDKFTASWNYYIPVGEDLLERKTVLGIYTNAGYFTGDVPFFERFYGGGIGSVRGFAYRGISPRSGHARDPIGGDFSASGTVELSFPLAGDNLRGVVFADAGTVESKFNFGVIRTSAGAGIRFMIPFLGQAPFALDFAIPINRGREDDTQVISFSLGLGQ